MIAQAGQKGFSGWLDRTRLTGQLAIDLLMAVCSQLFSTAFFHRAKKSCPQQKINYPLLDKLLNVFQVILF